MKIGIFGSGGFYPLQNGALGIISYEMTRHLSHLGHEILVLVPINNRTRISQKERVRPMKGVSFEFIDAARDFFRGNCETLRILSRFKRECDVVHYNLPPANLQAFAPFFIHDRPQTYWYLGDVHNYPFRFSVFTLSLRFIDKILVCCNYTVGLLKQIGVSPNRITFVPEAVNVERYSSASPLKLDGKPSLLFVGRLDSKDKDVRALLEAFRLVKANIPSACLHIMGGGRSENECKEYAKRLRIDQGIVWWGNKDNIELPRYYKGSDMVIYPISQYLSTGIGLVVLEAMAACKPVITTAIPGNREFLRDGQNALLSPPGDARSLAEKIFMLYYDQEMTERLANNGFEFVKDFDWRKVVLRLEAVWKDMI